MIHLSTSIKMLEKMKLMYTKNEPGAKPVNEPKAKPCYTEFMFVDDEIFDDELFEELLDPDYKLQARSRGRGRGGSSPPRNFQS